MGGVPHSCIENTHGLLVRFDEMDYMEFFAIDGEIKQ
jgi:hypothetical protein